ncbi:MAG: Zinc ribbon domain protein [Lentisphaerae bacterium ADurb.BinA184]|nr:MAG: Zinc ribbon domain protein [Lentisphaerae bacterium ADurb.BinA184]
MPTYEYKCQDCGGRFDVFQSMSDRPLTHCRLCKTGRVKRLIGTGAGIIFKGSGFYCTDYRSDGYKSAASREKSSPAPAADSSAKTAAPAGDAKSPTPAKTTGGTAD